MAVVKRLLLTQSGHSATRAKMPKLVVAGNCTVAVSTYQDTVHLEAGHLVE